jgi:hypothetical protein
MPLRPPPVWWPRTEPNVILTPVKGGRARAPGLETFGEFPLHKLWRLAVRQGALPAARALPARLTAADAARWADAFEPLIPEVCWTDGDSEALERATPYLHVLRAGYAVTLAPGPDHAAAWLSGIRERRIA